MMITGIILVIVGIVSATVTSNLDNVPTFITAVSFVLFAFGILLIEQTIKKNRVKKK